MNELVSQRDLKTIDERLPQNYRYKYTLTLFAGMWRHSYDLVGRHGGLHFHITQYSEDHAGKYGTRHSAGLEQHWRQPPDYMRNDPPSQDECWLLKQPCWHDGTTMYAEEVILPIWLNAEHDEMFKFLAREADQRFNVTEDGK